MLGFLAGGFFGVSVEFNDSNPEKRGISLQPVFIFGLPRSGTTWLGKIFDSHPRTLLRHEPDAITFTQEFPFMMNSADIDRHLTAARKYLLARANDRYLRCVSNRPHFKKDYRRTAAELLRESLIYLFEGLNVVAGGKLDRRLEVPDLIAPNEPFSTVMKSVDSVGRVPLFAKSCPDCRFVYILRHPCGVASSKIRGKKIGKMNRVKAFRALLNLDSAQSRGFTLQDLQSWSEIETHAWLWVLINEFVIDNTRHLDNVRILIYDELCMNPTTIAQDLLNWTEVGFPPQTRTYINKCLTTPAQRRTGYYSTTQNPAAASEKWVHELSDSEIEIISAICKSSPVGRIFLDNREGDLQIAH